MPEDDRFAAGDRVRREVLSDDYVDSRGTSSDLGAQALQRFVTEMAWGVWTRDGMSRRDRSLIVLATTGALGRMEEFRLHLRGARRNGVEDTEIDELVLQLAAYAGAPAGVAAGREVRGFRTEEGSAS